ncbi:MAG: glycosyltransferase family 10 domain-containing protein [Mucilaginibacter sp.]
MRKKIKITFQNGISKESAQKAILNELVDEYDFEESSDPDFILFGPYGNDIPPPGEYIRIGYYCENIKPDMSVCDWAFGIPHEEEINDSRYKRIQWHEVDEKALIKSADYNADEIFAQKKGFCAFVYNSNVPYREEFFRQLSRYKKVDAPGRSMNNMLNQIDTKYKGGLWERKQQFLSSYKFTIAFENYVYPGYQTEKIYDAMLANSIPVYCGDPLIGNVFNTSSFVNAPDFVEIKQSPIINYIEKHSQQDFKDIRPAYYNTPYDKVKRKVKMLGRQWKMKLQFDNFNFGKVIERVIELDQDPNKYMEVLRQPWFNNNTPPANLSSKNRWMEIFSNKYSN